VTSFPPNAIATPANASKRNATVSRANFLLFGGCSAELRRDGRLGQALIQQMSKKHKSLPSEHRRLQPARGDARWRIGQSAAGARTPSSRREPGRCECALSITASVQFHFIDDKQDSDCRNSASSLRWFAAPSRALIATLKPRTTPCVQTTLAVR